MSKPLPPLNSLRAFEAAARYSSVTLAASELNVTPSALSHQIRALEEFVGRKLFSRGARSISLTRDGRLLYPGLQAGFGLIRDAVSSLGVAGDDRVLVVSVPPGFTSKWLARRLYRFAEAHPDIEVRISSTMAFANFGADGVDVAIRNVAGLVVDDPTLVYEKLLDVGLVPVCSPKLATKFGRLDAPDILTRLPLIHDDQLASRPGFPGWPDWLKIAGVEAGDFGRGMRFSSPDHALDAAIEGAGVLLTHSILAYDELASGRLAALFNAVLPSHRAYYFVCPKTKEKNPSVLALRAWVREEIRRLDRKFLLVPKAEPR